MKASEIPLFHRSGSVPCRCSYRERVVRQATIAGMPNNRCVDGCHLALPPRLWHPLKPEVGDEVERHNQDPSLHIIIVKGIMIICLSWNLAFNLTPVSKIEVTFMSMMLVN